MSMNLEDLIRNAALSAVEGEQSVETDVSVKTASAPAPVPAVDEIEKLAAACEFVGNKGVENLLKEASAAPPEGTNAGDSALKNTAKQVPPSKHSPAMKSSGPNPQDNGSDKALTGDADTTGKGNAKSHSGLSSNEAAIGVQKKHKAQQVDSSLKKLLSASAFADPAVKQNLSNASKAGERNIHSSKTASVEEPVTDAADLDKEQIRKALAKKLAEHNGATA
jgi:hypothetical protein